MPTFRSKNDLETHSKAVRKVKVERPTTQDAGESDGQSSDANWRLAKHHEADKGENLLDSVLTPEQHQIKKLELENNQLRMDVATLKRLSAFFSNEFL